MPVIEKEQEVIEVEVLEIDGIAPARDSAKQEKIPRPRSPFDWRKWLSRILKLDRRFWPIWVLLGAVALFLLLTVGVVAGVIYLVYTMIRNFLLEITSAFRS